MPSSLLSPIFEVVLEIFLHFFCYFIGRIAVPVVSLGRWRCERITHHVPRKKLRAAGFYYRRDGRVYVTAEATEVLGLVLAILIISAVALFVALR